MKRLIIISVLPFILSGCIWETICPDKPPVVLRPPKAAAVAKPKLESSELTIQKDGIPMVIKALESDITVLGVYSEKLENVIRGYEKYTEGNNQ
jgi:hypothetical protein